MHALTCCPRFATLVLRAGEIADRCLSCPYNTYNSANSSLSQDACAACPENTITRFPGTVSRDNCVAAPNFLLIDGEVAACTEGLNCSAPATVLSQLQVTPGYWRASRNTANVRKCTITARCAGGGFARNTSDANAMCAPGHHGPYCAVWYVVKRAHAQCTPL